MLRIFAIAFASLLLLGYTAVVVVAICNEDELLLHPKLDERGKQYYVNELQPLCDSQEYHICPSGALIYELQFRSTVLNQERDKDKDKEKEDKEGDKEDDDGNRTILLCHGNAGTVLDFRPFIGLLKRKFNRILLMEYRGFGAAKPARDTRVITANMLLEDTEQSLHLLKRTGYTHLDVVLGFSIGGGVISQVFTGSPALSAKKFVILNSFASIPLVVKHHLSIAGYPIQKRMKCQWNSANALKEILTNQKESEVLWVSTKDDRLILPGNTDVVRLSFQNFTERTTFIELPNGGHNASVFVHLNKWLPYV